MKLGLCLVGLSGCLLVTRFATAQRVQGRLENFRLLQNPVWAEARDPKNHGYSFREPVPTVRAEFRRLYPHIPKEICIAALADAPQKPSGTSVLVRVGGGRTTPVTLVVVPGTKLVFQNTDPFKHRLYAVGVKTFTANDTLRGATREWSVPEPGIFEIRDEAAPSIRTFIVAEPNVAAIAYPSLKGDFALTVAAAGEYKIQAFFAGKRTGPEIPVKVEARDVDLTRSPIRLVDDKAAAKAAKDEAEGVAEAKAAAAAAAAAGGAAAGGAAPGEAAAGGTSGAPPKN